MHGHQMRLQAAEDRTDQWTDIKPGALYGVLSRLEREGLVAEARTERQGNYPERTVYEITADGRRALEPLRDQMLRTVVFDNDPFDLALAHSGVAAEETLREIVQARLLELNGRLAAGKPAVGGDALAERGRARGLRAPDRPAAHRGGLAWAAAGHHRQDRR